MNKSMYSLILSDDVVSEIDRLALRRGTNRSNMVDRILAEYASVLTPEMRIGEIYRHIEELMRESEELVPVLTSRGSSLSVKSSLNYKYRPTIRYEVQLYLNPDRYIGELNVIIRTQSDPLLNALTDFFRLLRKLEDAYISESVGPIRYELYDGHFVRSIAVPRSRDYSGNELGDAISRYVEMLDDLMKDYVARGNTPEQIEDHYAEYLKNGVGWI